jgi:hypothetical protein
MHVQMCRDLFLSIAVFCNGINDCFIPLAFIEDYLLREEFIESGPVRKAMASRDFRGVLIFFDIGDQALEAGEGGYERWPER